MLVLCNDRSKGGEGKPSQTLGVQAGLTCIRHGLEHGGKCGRWTRAGSPANCLGVCRTPWSEGDLVAAPPYSCRCSLKARGSGTQHRRSPGRHPQPSSPAILPRGAFAPLQPGLRRHLGLALPEASLVLPTLAPWTAYCDNQCPKDRGQIQGFPAGADHKGRD